MKVISIIIGILLVIVIVYALYTYYCECCNLEMFTNEDMNIKIYESKDFLYSTDNNIIINEKPLVYLTEEQFSNLKYTDAYPIYNLLSVDKQPLVISNSTSYNINTTIELTGFIPVKTSNGYRLYNFGNDGSKYGLFSRIDGNNNPKKVVIIPIETYNEYISNMTPEFMGSMLFGFTQDNKIEILKEDGTKLNRILGYNGSTILSYSAETLNNHELVIVQKELGKHNIIVANNIYYQVNMERYIGEDFESFMRYVLTSSVLNISENELKELIDLDGVVYFTNKSSYPLCIKYYNHQYIGVFSIYNPNKQLPGNKMLSLFADKDIIKDDVYFSKKEIIEPNDTEPAIDISDTEDNINLITKTTNVIAEPKAFDGIYISGGVANTFITSAFGNKQTSSTLPKESTTNINVEETTVTDITENKSPGDVLDKTSTKLASEEIVEKHQEYNSGVCEYSLTNPQSCNMYEPACGKPDNRCYTCGSNNCNCQNKALMDKYYKPYLR